MEDSDGCPLFLVWCCFNWFCSILSLFLQDDVTNPYVVALKLRMCTLLLLVFRRCLCPVGSRWKGWSACSIMLVGFECGYFGTDLEFVSFIFASKCAWVILGIRLVLVGLVLCGLWSVFGLGSWSIPDDLYAGWLRILSAQRFGHRVPIDA